jgi:PEP-CTERM motif
VINLYTGQGYSAYDNGLGQIIAINASWTLMQVTSSVPEPASLAILSTALAGLGLTRRRRSACNRI